MVSPIGVVLGLVFVGDRWVFFFFFFSPCFVGGFYLGGVCVMVGWWWLLPCWGVWWWWWLLPCWVCVVVAVAVAVAVAEGRGGCRWCCRLFFGRGIYYFTEMVILFYCDVYIILLY